ncbi:metallophosphoesterase [Acinetobacter pollinis]|uniref:metallophosphoesterase n=1 Tax=Acinetobacter pollinis TaxID=2605270 RepID=UPI0018A2F8B7|nr:metallophosphoesterase [Acinetobacter pollinis]MBF7691463.1 metallophosphoesterase [Acinetobacter pollinis]MBF7693840.1 metallophosphoesterase [Acinetobacter pollinis]MBF7699144.1 metallophosphoesterase [Acinetobacter pollinis]MBF7701768.1 metallophosphoesterase [Acinetobacter pollinis]
MLDSNSIFNFFYIIFFIVALWATLQSWKSQSKTETIHPFKAFIHLLIFYQSYLFIPFLVFICTAYLYDRVSAITAGILGLLSIIFIYARFIEPNWLRTKHTSYQLDSQHPFHQPFKIALIADLHIGLFSGHEKQLETIVKIINKERPDIVVVAGDWTYEPENTLAEELSILKQIDVPVYSVLGNHDEEYPGPPIQELLNHALESNHIMDIEGKIVEFDHFRLLGVGDLWAGKTDMCFMPDLPQDKPWVIVSHNPDTVEMVPKLPTKPLMLAGHTHGGQVELPWLTSYMMKKASIMGHKRGLYHHLHANVYVTVGTGMVGVPFRFRVRPTVDIIELT